jgi:hypothetical protein
MELISSEYKTGDMRIEINAERQEVWVVDEAGHGMFIPFGVVHGMHAVIAQIMGGNEYV